MIKIDEVHVYGWKAAIRGMRNIVNGLGESDSYHTYIENPETLNTAEFEYFIGESDLNLMKSLSNTHGILKLINATCDITASYKWWGEFLDFDVVYSGFGRIKTVQINYQELKNIYRNCVNRKSNEWNTFRQFIEMLPYSELITGEETTHV